MTRTTPSTYQGQHLKAKRRKGGSTAFYFHPKREQVPETWIARHGASVRLPRDIEKRTGLGDPIERGYAWADAGLLYAELQEMRSAPADGSQWPHGSLRWLVQSYKASTWFREEITAETRRGYLSELAAVEAWADEVAGARGVHPHVRKMTVRGIASFLSRYDDRKTRRQHLRAILNNLFTHAIQLGVVDENPMGQIRLSRARKNEARKRPTILWDRAFVAAAAKEAERRGRLEVAGLIWTMWDIGQRPTDLYHLIALNELDRKAMERNLLKPAIYYDPFDEVIRGWQSKTASFIAVPLSKATRRFLRRISPAPHDNQRHIFVNPHTGKPFTANQFDHIFKKCAAVTEMPGTRFGHGRHSCIVELYKAGCSDAEVTSITGHTNPATTKRKYWAADDDQAASAQAKRERYEAGQ